MGKQYLELTPQHIDFIQQQKDFLRRNRRGNRQRQSLPKRRRLAKSYRP